MKQKQNKGITLIALVITIIVMLILVSVTINMAVNGGLFNYASKASKDTENAYSYEQGILSGRIKVGGIWYDSPEDYVANKPSGSQNDLPVAKIATVTNIKLGVATAEGTEEDPIYVYSVDDLVLLSENVNNGDTYDGKYLKMVRDIDFEDNNCYLDTSIKAALIDRDGNGFTPIGIGGKSFNGIFDGTNHEIKNFYKKNSLGGLFFQVQGATIKNLGIGGTYSANGPCGLVGTISASERDTIIQNCYNECNINSPNMIAGGIVGMAGSTSVQIIDCYNTGNITAGWGTAGIIGNPSASTTIYGCHNSGNLSGSSTGGISGGGSPVVSNCYNTGDVSSTGSAGGISGERFCYNIKLL